MSNIPHKDILDAAFLVPNSRALTGDSKDLLSAIGSRDGIPETKRCFNFGGVGDYVTVPHHSSLGFGDGVSDLPFSISFNINLPNIVSQNILTKGNQGTNNREFLLRTEANGAIGFYLSNPSGANYIGATGSDLSAYAGEWLFVVVTYDGSGLNTGIGITVRTEAADIPQTLAVNSGGTYVAITAAAPLYLGVFSTTYGAFKLSDFRIHNIELTASDINNVELHKTSENEVGWWKCDSGWSAGMYDSSGSPFHIGVITFLDYGDFFYIGSDVPYGFKNETGFNQYYDDHARDESNLTKAVTGSELQRKGKIKQLAKIANVDTMDFNGVDTYVSIPHSPDLSFGDGVSDTPFSITAWITKSTSSNPVVIFSKGLNASQEYSFELDTIGRLTLIVNTDASNYKKVYSNQLVFQGRTLLIVATYNGSGSLSVGYLNWNAYTSTLVQTTIGTYVAMAGAAVPAQIGRVNDNYNTNTDPIFDVRIHNKVLTLAEMQSLVTGIPDYNAFFKAGGRTGYEVGAWSMGEGSGSVVYDRVGNNNGTVVGSRGKSRDIVSLNLVEGCEVYDDDATHLIKIKVPFNLDGSRATPIIAGYSKVLDYKGVESEKRIPSELDLMIDFQAYKALHSSLPTAHQVGDPESSKFSADVSGSKKFLVSSKDISNIDRIKRYNRIVDLSTGNLIVSEADNIATMSYSINNVAGREEAVLPPLIDRVYITGTLTSGSVLTANLSNYTSPNGKTLGAITYKWYDDGNVLLQDSASPTYTILVGDVGNQIYVTATPNQISGSVLTGDLTYSVLTEIIT
jgi:hypothetical protein